MASIILRIVTDNEYFLFGLFSIALSMMSLYLTFEYNDRSKKCRMARVISLVTISAICLVSLVILCGLFGIILFITAVFFFLMCKW